MILYARKYVSRRERPLTLADQDVRTVARSLKQAHGWAVALAAEEMANIIPVPCPHWLVPVPNSQGDLTANDKLARAIARLSGGRVKRAIRRTQPVESSCELRRRGFGPLPVSEHHIERTPELLQALPVFFVDNVVTSGNTIRACQMALGWGEGLVYADASTRHNQHFRFSQVKTL